MGKNKIILLCAIPIVIVCSCLVFFILSRDNSVPASTNKETTKNTIDNSIDDVVENTIDNEIDNTEVLTENNTTELEKKIEQKPTEKPSKNTNNQNSNINTSTNNNTNGSINANTNTNTNINIPSTPSDSQDNTSQDNQDPTSTEPQKPTTPTVPEVIITYYGDANEDGTLDIADVSTIKRHLEGINTISGQSLKNADINADGKVNNVDVVLLQGALAKIYSHQITKPLTSYVLYGDANEDGVLDIADSITIKMHVEGSNLLKGQALKNADVNNDGNVDKTDATLVQEFLANMHPNTLPNKPII